MGTEDSWADCRSGGDGVGVSNGEKGKTTVTEQQLKKNLYLPFQQ